MKCLIGSFLTAIFFTSIGIAQQPAQPAQPEREERGQQAHWRAQLPGGSFVVGLASITAVSIHEYVVDGAARVTEANISTTSPLVARFYYIEPLVPQAPLGVGQSTVEHMKEKLQEVQERTGTEEVWQKVVKNYPLTTHAGTVEFRLATREQVQNLFRSAERSWLRQQSGTYKP